MSNEKKVSLRLEVEFTRKKFVGEDGREVPYVQCVAEYNGESFRFSVKDKDARLFQYLMKQDGYQLFDMHDNPVTEG